MSTGKKGTRLEEGWPEEELRHWMIDETEVHTSGSGEVAHEEPQQRRDREGTLEREFRSLIVGLQSVTGAMRSMEQRMD